MFHLTPFFIMTKVKSPVISLMMRKSKTNSKGEHPIVLTVSMSGRVEKASGVWLLEKHWDAQRQAVKRSCPNYLNVHQTLSNLKRKYEDKKMELEMANQPYTVKDILSEQSTTTYESKAYEDLVGLYRAHSGICNGTFKTYMQTYRRLSKSLGEGFSIDGITTAFIRKWMAQMLTEGLKGSNVFKHLKSCHTICMYALSKGLIASDPFYGVRINLEKTHRLYFLQNAHVRFIAEYLADMLKAEGGAERLHRRWGDEFAVGFFYILLKLNGAAPIDAALLRVKDVSRKVLGGEEYYQVQFRRRKTNVAVEVLWKVDWMSNMLLGSFLEGKGEDDYVYPILRGGEKDVVKTTGNVTRHLVVRLRRWLDEVINNVIKRWNGYFTDKVDYIYVDKVVYYTARHTLATNYLNSAGANPAELAQIMGRSVSGIGNYVHQLTDEESALQRLRRMSF